MDAKLNPFAPLAALQPPGSAFTLALFRTARLFLSKTGRPRLPGPWNGRALSHAGADELRGMSDHELKDLGVGRSQIPHILGHRAADGPCT